MNSGPTRERPGRVSRSTPAPPAPARNLRLAGDVVERRPGHAAAGDARAHRVHDPRRLVALDGPLSGRRLHGAQPTRATASRPPRRGDARTDVVKFVANL